MDKINIFWHRRDLRHFDNAGLYYALDNENPVLPIFIFDRHILDELEDEDDARITFIHREITRLNDVYSKHKSGLRVFYGTPEEVFKTLVNEYKIDGVYTNRDYEPYANSRDQKINDFLKENDVDFYTFKDQVIFEKGEILTESEDPYKVFTPYKNKWLGKFHQMEVQTFDSEKKLSQLYKFDCPAIPSLSDMGFKASEITLPTAEVKDKTLEQYEEKRNFPALDATSRLGVHLRFGTVSIRQLVSRASSKSETWLNELIWREFYMMILAHYPKVVDNAFKAKYDNIPWVNDEKQFKKWCEGKTGYPIVDAGMRELNATGYMHNRVRMVVASFLTKHLLIDWRWGERYFARKLLDFELSSNNGGWQWAAGTGTDAQPYFRVFNPASQQEKFDNDHAYIKKWVPEFGTDKYPKPIVEHKQARIRAIETYKEAVS